MIVKINGQMYSAFLLTIKKKWYDMILSREKKEEYREFKTYYLKRFQNIGMITDDGFSMTGVERLICFRNGYSNNSPSFVARCTLEVGEGKTEWGAEKGVKYYILKIKEIIGER